MAEVPRSNPFAPLTSWPQPVPQAGTTSVAPVHPQAVRVPEPLPFSPPDRASVSTAQGHALPTVSLDTTPPEWSAGTKAQIRRSFQQGLQQYGITPQEITQLLRRYGISSLEINEANIQNPAYADEIKRIQLELGKRLNHPDLRAFGQGHAVGNDSQFGKGSVQAVAALRDALRGDPIELTVTPIRQQTRTGCYRTAETMLYNVLHGKNGTDEAYTEFDTRDRIKEQDLDKQEANATAGEDGNGRVSVRHDQAMMLLDSLDEELEAGRPVIAGVSYRKQDGVEYNEGITDHFVLISGRGYDQAGTFYTFQDPAGGRTHKLHLDPISGRLSGKGDMTGVYDVTLIHKAKVTDATTVAHYKQLGKVMFSQGQNSKAIQEMQLMLTAMGYDTKGTTGGYGNGTSTAVRNFQATHQLPQTGSSVDNHTLSAIQTGFREFQQNNPDKVMFKRGQSSTLIAPLQKILTKAGFSTNGTNGIFGPGTEKAIRAYQQAHHLPETGSLDNRTWLSILEQH
ncbi:MAG TPA: peptidoglycan-binding protein [Candidatus Obscuribacterales bacterium]